MHPSLGAKHQPGLMSALFRPGPFQGVSPVLELLTQLKPIDETTTLCIY